MSSKQYRKTAVKKPEEPVKTKTPAKVWAARILVLILCVAVVITLIPSAFF